MRTVITPEALNRSKFQKCTLEEWNDPHFKCADGYDGDELFYFQYPSLDIFNRENGDGDLMEVVDWNRDFSEMDVDVGGGQTITIKTTPETVLYYR